jgi:2-phospho-L-lactate guanylyltransferase
MSYRHTDHTARRAAFTVHAVVPVKELVHAKSRLAARLSPTARRALALNMLCHVLGVLRAVSAQHLAKDSATLQTVWVVSRDPTALHVATQYGAMPLPDSSSGLNEALNQARHTAVQAGAAALLVVPADVPLITCADIAGLIAALQPEALRTPPDPRCVVAPNQYASGTNALGVTLPSSLPFQFGIGSFSHYLRAALQRGMHVQVYISPTLALDIDTPDDLAQARQQILQQQILDTPCHACL